ncbi:MAG: MarR family transcriptional regulator [Lachnospiraceae bacterium]|nr:MarR family transcriptional regulator [Lachnospiraceae bacterium]
MNTDETLNEILVHLFQDLMDIEGRCLITEEFSDMTNNDMHIVEAIGLGEAKRSSEVAKLMSVTTGTLTRAVDGLVEHGYVVRTRSDKDKRVVYLTLTERGKAAYEHHKRFHENMVANVKANLSEEELAILIRALNHLNEYFRSAYA